MQAPDWPVIAEAACNDQGRHADAPHQEQGGVRIPKRPTTAMPSSTAQPLVRHHD